MTPYVDIQPNLIKDPTGNTMRLINYHHPTPQRLFTRSGEMYYFGPLDTKLEDRFIKSFPVCYQDDPPGRRRWYGKVVTHAVAHGMYVHDPFCFRTLSITQQNEQSQRKGFTCGTETDDEQFDIPEQFSSSLTRWSAKI